jgi:hypothetical protein
MANDTIGIYDHATGQNEIREMTKSEQDQRDLESAAYLLSKQASLIAKENARSIKIAAFTKLGLSAEEIDALVPVEVQPLQIPTP